MQEQETKELNKAKSYTPTQAMRNNAKRGLELRKKWKRGGLDASQANAEGVGSGVARARDIINGNLSLATVKRMNAFFSRHEKNYRPATKEDDGGPTAGTIAWLIWGGSSGKAWARSILRKEGLLEKSLDSFDYFEDVAVEVTKAKNEELMQVTFVAMLPDSVDLHGDYTSAEEVRKAMQSFNKSDAKPNLFHRMNTDTFDVIESYIAPVDFYLDEVFVEKGTWLMTFQVYDETLWSYIKSGEINGVSIGAKAVVENLEE
jgi:hypothetical protein